MRKAALIVFFLICVPLYSQNFHLKINGSYTFFPDVNSRQVSFAGVGIDYSLFFIKRVGINVGYDHFFPSTYYGLVKFDYYRSGFEEYTPKTLPAYITGGADMIRGGLQFKLIDPPSKKVELFGSLLLSYFMHQGSYNKDPFITYYGGGFLEDISTRVTFFQPELGCIVKIGNIPLFLSAGYNYKLIQEKESWWRGYSVPFSSSWVIHAGISLPVMQGTVPSEYKKIEYQEQ